MKFLKSLLVAVALFCTASIQAQQLQVLTSITAGTATNFLSGAYVIDNFIAINATTNNAVLKFYDSSTSSTNIVQATYTGVTQYATNISQIFTNESGVIITNTFSGIYTAPLVTAASTNSKPAIQTIIIPAGLTLNKDVKMITLRGLTAVSSADLTLLTTYRLP